MDMLKTINLSTITIADIIQTEKIWEDTVDDLKSYLSSFLVLSIDKDESDLKKLKFHQYQTYYFHPCLSGLPDKSWYPLLVKIAMHDNMSTNKKSNIGQFIYAKDKTIHIEARKVSPTTRDRFDMFKCRFETSKKTNKMLIRHTGTCRGQGAYGVDRSAEFRGDNKPLLRVLMFGPSGVHKLLSCPIEGLQIEQVRRFNPSTKKIEVYDCYEIHHVRFLNNESLYKSSSPSIYLNRDVFTNFSQAVIEEFLGSTVVSNSSHKIVHTQSSEEGIDSWFDRYAIGDCHYIPFHWKSEENYNKTLAWLESVCKNFKAAKALSYSEFMKKHCISTLSLKAVCYQK